MPDLVETAGVKSAGGRPYSPAVRAGDWLYLSGQVPIDAEGKTVGLFDPRAQWRQCLDNLKELLESVGASMSDIVFLQLYVTDMDAVYINNGDVRREYFEVPFPASTVTETRRLAQADWMIEIQATAYLGT